MSETLVRLVDFGIEIEDRGGATRTLVDDVSFAIGRGERVALIGESGSGKSLTAMAMIGLLPKGARQRGTVEYSGRAVCSLDRADLENLRGGKIGTVFQDALTAFNPVRTVGSIISESAMRHQSIDAHAARQKAIELLSELGVPDPSKRFDAYQHELSGGLRQRAMIALALINDPDFVVADEPTTALDATIQVQILELLRERSEGRGVLFITHDLTAASRLCDRALVMEQGKVIDEGRLPELLRAPGHPHTASLAASSHLFSEETEASVARVISRSERPLIEGSGLVKAFETERGRLHALRGVDINVYGSETFAIVGESGCGKSTLARCLVGALRPDEGSLSTPSDRLSAQFVFQDPYSSLDPYWRVCDIVAEPLRVQRRIPRDEARERARSLLDRVGIARSKHHERPAAFSGGQRQRIAIARALICDPEVVVADEPLSALDVTIQSQIVELLGELKAERDMSLVMVSHDIELVGRIADRVAVMYLGEIVECGPAAAVIDHPRHRYTEALVAATREARRLGGEAPSPLDLPQGCAFVGRCGAALPKCHDTAPRMQGDGERSFACWNPA